MITEEKRIQSRRLCLAWALWTFWTTDESVQFLRLLNPQKSWQQLRLPFSVFVVLPEEVMEGLYTRLHHHGSVAECKTPAIFRDLCRELELDLQERSILVA